MKKISLYIHIPFCKNICAYCDFPKILFIEKFIKPYLESLFCELKNLPKIPLKTIYIGGGTPLSLSCEDLENLFVFVKENFDLSQLEEYSIETTAIEITDKKIKLLKRWQIRLLHQNS